MTDYAANYGAFSRLLVIRLVREVMSTVVDAPRAELLRAIPDTADLREVEDLVTPNTRIQICMSDRDRTTSECRKAVSVARWFPRTRSYNDVVFRHVRLAMDTHGTGSHMGLMLQATLEACKITDLLFLVDGFDIAVQRSAAAVYAGLGPKNMGVEHVYSGLSEERMRRPRQKLGIVLTAALVCAVNRPDAPLPVFYTDSDLRRQELDRLVAGGYLQ